MSCSMSARDMESTNSSEFSSDKPTLKDTASIYGDFDDLDDYLSKNQPLIQVPNISVAPKLAGIRWGFFTTYRRLFSLGFLGNLIAFIIILARYRTLRNVINAVAANLVITGVSRLPNIYNVLYLIFCSLPRSWPLPIRRAAAKISHFGGVHSSCGAASLFWYIGFVVIFTRDYIINQPPRLHSTTLMILMYSILIVIVAIIASAYPMFRFKHHDWFERIHRFGSWLLLGLFWAFLIIFSDDAKGIDSLGSYFIVFPSFWFTIILTIAIILPWVTLRKVVLVPEHLSDHAVRLHFRYTTTGYGQGISLSTNPLKDWHNFAAVANPEADGPGFSCLVSKNGDWTGACIANQPTQLWKRSIPGSSFGRSIRMFKRVLLVTTGSGVGPCLSVLPCPDRPPIRILWSARSPRKTYGLGILELVSSVDSQALVIDTDKYGRQDLFPLAWNMAKEFDAEAVYIVARPHVVLQMVYEFEARGVPAFGPVFDS